MINKSDVYDKNNSGFHSIPEGWLWTKIDDIGNVVTGTTPSKSNPNYYGNHLPFIKPGDLNKGKDINSSEEYLSCQL